MIRLLPVLIAICIFAKVLCNEDIAKLMENHEVVPDVIRVAPTKLIEIKYPSGVEVNAGNELTPTQVKDKPTVKWESDDNTFYTLIMTDPDAPSRADPKFREFKHWLVCNIPGNKIDSGVTLAEYIGSGPPNGTGLHRYVFLVYEQNEKLDLTNEGRTSNSSRTNRPKFSAQKFANKFNLGTPIAGNFYQAKYDDYVPILNAQLSQ